MVMGTDIWTFRYGVIFTYTENTEIHLIMSVVDAISTDNLLEAATNRPEMDSNCCGLGGPLLAHSKKVSKVRDDLMYITFRGFQLRVFVGLELGQCQNYKASMPSGTFEGESTCWSVHKVTRIYSQVSS